MKRLLLLAPLALFATTGDNLIGAGAKSRAVAGAGIASYQGAESIFINPALLTYSTTSSMEIGTTLFSPDVTANGYKSQADFELIPYLGYTKALDSSSAFGLGLFSVSGMGVDYRSADLAFMRTKFAYAQLIGAYAKRFGNVSIGGGVNLSYGKLNMAARMPLELGDHDSDDVGVGYNLGAEYHTDHLSLAATYTSSVAMNYKNVFDFDRDGQKENFHLTQPAQIGFGASYKKDGLEILADFKRIFWSRAEGYKDFCWQSQNVYSIGVQKSIKSTTLKAGYSYATKVMDRFLAKNVEGLPFRAQDIAFFNLVGFPAISRRHISFGASFKLRSFTLNLAYVYSPKESLSSHGLQATNRQNSFTMGVEYGF